MEQCPELRRDENQKGPNQNPVTNRKTSTKTPDRAAPCPVLFRKSSARNSKPRKGKQLGRRNRSNHRGSEKE